MRIYFPSSSSLYAFSYFPFCETFWASYKSIQMQKVKTYVETSEYFVQKKEPEESFSDQVGKHERRVPRGKESLSFFLLLLSFHFEAIFMVLDVKCLKNTSNHLWRPYIIIYLFHWMNAANKLSFIFSDENMQIQHKWKWAKKRKEACTFSIENR